MQSNKINDFFGKAGINIIIKYKYIFLIIVVMMFVLGVMGSKQIVINTSYERILAKNDDTVQMKEKFEEMFGNEEFIFILVEADEIFQKDVLQYIRNISEDIKERLPFVDDVVSVTDMEYIDVIDGDLYIHDLVGKKIPSDRNELNDIKQKVLSKKLYIDRIITKDAKKTGIVVSFTEIPESVYLSVEKEFSPIDEAKWANEDIILANDIYTKKDSMVREDLVEVSDARKLIAPALKVIFNSHQNEDIKLTATGFPIIDYESDVVVLQDGSKVGLIGLLLAVITLFIIFRNFSGVIAPFFVMVITIIVTFGIIGWFKLPVSMSIIVITPLILVISVSYSIHVINHFRHEFKRTGNRLQALRYTYKQATWPCLLTSLTTVIGFISFLFVPILTTKSMGVICAIGVFTAYIFVMIIVPIILSFGKKQKKIKMKKMLIEKNKSPLMQKFADFVIKHAVLSTIIGLIFMALMIFFSFQLKIDNQITEMIGTKVKFVKDYQHIINTLGGAFNFEVLVELPEEDMVKEPEVLKAIEKLDEKIQNWEGVKLTTSLNNVVKDLNMTLNNNDENYYRIPDNKDLIAQYLFLYELSGGENISKMVDYNFQTTHLTIQVGLFSIEYIEKFDELEKYASSLFPTGTKVTVTGDMPIALKIMDSLGKGQIQSIFFAFLAITLFMMIILRSSKTGLISMIPNVLPIFVISGLMGLFKMSLDLMTIMIAPMIIGIAVDDTVHYFIHFRQEFEKSGSYKIANRETFTKVGSALIFTSIILTAGFAVFALSSIKSLFNLAILSSAGILSALIADLFITPVLFVFFKPFGKEK